MLTKGSGITCGYPISDTPSLLETLDKTKHINTNICSINLANNSSVLMLYLTLVISVITLIVAVMVLVETYKLRSLEDKGERRN